MAARGIGADLSRHTKKQKLKLRRRAELLTVVGDVIPSPLNRPKFFSLHDVDFFSPSAYEALKPRRFRGRLTLTKLSVAFFAECQLVL
jgi:hypothetical protein